jgi:UDP-N-acetylmuramoyl-L-alanyl-D-glutamate--2,6-diaminopimelate ligase
MIKDCRARLEGFGLEDSSNGKDTQGFSVIEKAGDLTLTTNNGVMGITFKYSGHFPGVAALSIPGRFNVMNALCAITVASHFTTDTKLISDALSGTHVRGRLEPVKISDKCSLLIDYAHNAMALESVIKTLRDYSPKRLVVLFGCGGNRSKDRRYEMGEVSSKLADLTVVTSDNPRFEKPEDIIEDILTGVKRANGTYITIPDRRDAIRYVIENAKEGDCILLAGKGNEDYQEIEGVRYHMDEREIIADIMKEIGTVL